MKEDESIHDFHLSIFDIANSFESLGEKMSDEKLARKILRSLPKRFDMNLDLCLMKNDCVLYELCIVIGGH
jgi:hypothetical protein